MLQYHYNLYIYVIHFTNLNMPNFNKEDEFFLAIGQQGKHSFLMLGVMDNDQPRLLARVGKRNDIDPDYKSEYELFKKALGSGSLSRLGDEGLFRPEGHYAKINYQAYAITYSQLKEFFGLIASIEKNHLENTEISQALKNRYKELKFIECLIPVEEESNSNLVKFEFKKLQTANFLTDIELQSQISQKIDIQPLAVKGQRIKYDENCRYFAKYILEAILGFQTSISKYFFIKPKHQTELNGGQPDAKTFYVLPIPPNIKHLSPEKSSALLQVYKRLEQIPLINPKSQETRDKFNSLKSLYNNLSGKNKLSAKDFLTILLEHESNQKQFLYKKRGNNPFSQCLMSSSKKALDNIKRELTKKINKDEKQNKIEKIRPKLN